MFLEELRHELVERGYDDLSPTHVNIMPMLDVDGTSAQVLATRIGISKQAAGKIVAELQRAGYVRTERDPSDARARLVVFSKKGRALLDDGEKAKLAALCSKSTNPKIAEARSKSYPAAMQDKTIDNVLRHLHRECMNGRHGGLMWIMALMHMRGVKPDFQRYAKPYGSRQARREARRARQAG